MSRRARQQAARASADNLIEKLMNKICSLEATVETLVDRLALALRSQDNTVADRLPLIEATLPYVALGIRPPHAQTLQRNVAAHVPDTMLQGRAVQSLTPVELRAVQKGRPFTHKRAPVNEDAADLGGPVAGPGAPERVVRGLRAAAPAFAPAAAPASVEEAPRAASEEAPGNEPPSRVDLPPIPDFPSFAPKWEDSTAAEAARKPAVSLQPGCGSWAATSIEHDRVIEYQAKLIDNQNATIGMLLTTTTGKNQHRRKVQEAPRAASAAQPQEDAQMAGDSEQPREALAAAQQTIAALRHQAAAQTARVARMTELQDNGRLLRTVHIPAGAPIEHYTYADIFLRHSGASAVLNMSDPYFVSGYQLDNLRLLVSEIASKTHVRKILITTHERAKCQEAALNSVVREAAAQNITATISFVQDLHHRELQFSNGITVSCDRGLDIYKPTAAGGRCCRNAAVHVFETSVKYLADQSDAVALVVEKAAEVMQEAVVKEATMINEYLHAVPPTEEAQCMRKTRLELYEAKLMHIAQKTHRPHPHYRSPVRDGHRDGLHAVVRSVMWCTDYNKSCFDCACKGACSDLQKFVQQLPALLEECERYNMVERKGMDSKGHVADNAVQHHPEDAEDELNSHFGSVAAKVDEYLMTKVPKYGSFEEALADEARLKAELKREGAILEQIFSVRGSSSPSSP